MTWNLPRQARSWIAGSVSLLAAGLFAGRIWPHLGAMRGHFHPWAACLIALVVLSVQGLQAWKLRLLLPQPPPFPKLLGVCLLGNFFGAMFFTQLAGDLCKLWMLGQDDDTPGKTMAVLRDRLSSCAAVGLTLAWAAAGGGPAASALTLTLLAIAAALSGPGERWVVALLAWCSGRWKSIPRFDPEAVVPPGRWRWLAVHTLSGGIQAAGALAVWAALRWAGAGLDGTGCALLASVSALAVLLPLTAGGIGVREVSSYALLLHWGIAEPSAAAGIAHLTTGFLLGCGLGALIGWPLLKPRPAPARNAHLSQVQT